MSAGNYNIADLTQVLYNGMAGVSSNIFTSRPMSVPSTMNDFVVVEFPASLYDRLGVGYTMCRVCLYVRDVSVNGIVYENISKLKTMQDSVYTKLPITNSKCIITNPRPISMGSDKLGFHSVFINLNVTII